MNATCPNCGADLPEGPGTHCPACAVRPPGPLDLAARPADDLPADEPPVSRPLAPPAVRAAGWLLPISSALACGWYGHLIEHHGQLAAPLAVGAPVGGLVGLVLGLLLWRDDRALWRHVRDRWASTADADEPLPSFLRPPSELLAGLMLIVPLVTGVLIWQRQALRLDAQTVTALSCATVLGTALLGYADTRRWVFYFAESRPGEEPPVGPGWVYFGMLIIWVLFFPAYFLLRRRLGAATLIVPALVGTAVFMGPSLAPLFTEPDLPAATAPEVLATVKQALESIPQNVARQNELGHLTVSDAEELSFDPQAQRRVGRAKLTTNRGAQVIFYTVEWQDRRKGMFQIRTFDHQP